MGGGMGGNFGNTKGSRRIHISKDKGTALKSISNLPEPIQKSAKSFFKRSSNKYNKYSVTKNKDGTYTLKMEKPGIVPDSKAIYYKIIDELGNLIKIFKDTFDPKGNLIHRKEK